MDLKDLRCFVAVAQTRSVTKAAGKLFMTQPALSRQLSALEKELGIRLLDREARPLELTFAGERFYEQARHILKMEQDLIEDMERIKSGDSYRLFVEYGMAGHVPLVTQALIRFRSRFPDARIDVRRQYNALALQDLVERRCDLCVINKPDIPDNGDFRTRIIQEEGMYAFIPYSHPLYSRTFLKIEDLEGMKVCIFERFASPMMFDKILSFLSEKGIRPEEIGQAPDTSTFTLMLLLHNMIGIMPRSTMNGDPSLISAIPVLETEGLDVAAVWMADNRNPAIQPFLSGLEHMKEM